MIVSRRRKLMRRSWRAYDEGLVRKLEGREKEYPE